MGTGATTEEAAIDAQQRWRAGERGKEVVVKIGTAIETNQAMPITARGGSRAIDPDHMAGSPPATLEVPTPGGAIAGGFPPSAGAVVSPGGAKAGGIGPTARVGVPPGGVEADGGQLAEQIKVSGDRTARLWQRLGAMDMAVYFAEEPSGDFRAYLVQVSTQEVLRSASGPRLVDAYLELGCGFLDPTDGLAYGPDDPK